MSEIIETTWLNVPLEISGEFKILVRVLLVILSIFNKQLVFLMV